MEKQALSDSFSLLSVLLLSFISRVLQHIKERYQALMAAATTPFSNLFDPHSAEFVVATLLRRVFDEIDVGSHFLWVLLQALSSLPPSSSLSSSAASSSTSFAEQVRQAKRIVFARMQTIFSQWRQSGLPPQHPAYRGSVALQRRLELRVQTMDDGISVPTRLRSEESPPQKDQDSSHLVATMLTRRRKREEDEEAQRKRMNEIDSASSSVTSLVEMHISGAQHKESLSSSSEVIELSAEEVNQRTLMHAVDMTWGRDVDAVFRYPVDVRFNPRYTSVVKTPVSLTTIYDKIRSGEISTDEELREAFRLMKRNCASYNGDGCEWVNTATDLINVMNRSLKSGERDFMKEDGERLVGYGLEMKLRELFPLPPTAQKAEDLWGKGAIVPLICLAPHADRCSGTKDDQQAPATCQLGKKAVGKLTLVRKETLTSTKQPDDVKEPPTAAKGKLILLRNAKKEAESSRSAIPPDPPAEGELVMIKQLWAQCDACDEWHEVEYDVSKLKRWVCADIGKPCAKGALSTAEMVTSRKRGRTGAASKKPSAAECQVVTLVDEEEHTGTTKQQKGVKALRTLERGERTSRRLKAKQRLRQVHTVRSSSDSSYSVSSTSSDSAEEISLAARANRSKKAVDVSTLSSKKVPIKEQGEQIYGKLFGGAKNNKTADEAIQGGVAKRKVEQKLDTLTKEWLDYAATSLDVNAYSSARDLIAKYRVVLGMEDAVKKLSFVP